MSASPVPNKLTNDPELGWVTADCSTCMSLRHQARELTVAQLAGVEVHPNDFLAVFAARHTHEAATKHQTFGWRFLLESRKKALAFAAEPGSPFSAFWRAFVDRYLTLPTAS